MSRIVINFAIDHLNRNKRVTYMEDHSQSDTGDEHAVPLEEKLDLYQAFDRLIAAPDEIPSIHLMGDRSWLRTYM